MFLALSRTILLLGNSVDLPNLMCEGDWPNPYANLVDLYSGLSTFAIFITGNKE